MATTQVSASLGITMVSNSMSPGRRPRIEIKLTDGQLVRLNLSAQEFTDALSGLYITGLQAEVTE